MRRPSEPSRADHPFNIDDNATLLRVGYIPLSGAG